MSHKFLQGSSLLFACCITGAALAQTPQSTEPPSARSGGSTVPDRSSMHATAAMRKPLTAESFADQVAVIGKAEIELGRLALKNSKDAEVQKFAQRMITDHTNADQQLKSIAAKQALELPRQLDPEHQALKEKLAKLQGADFDREYTKAMAEGHDKAVALFEAASRDVQLPNELKQFAAATLPTLQDHRDMAHDIKE